MNTYYSLTAYNSLMEGNPDKTIDFYNKLPQQILDDDNYHRYFYALALKATENRRQQGINVKTS